MTGGSSCSGGVITAATVEWRRLTSAMTSNGNVCKRQERQTRQETADIEDLQQRPHNHHHHRPVESHRGHRETFLRAPKHFRRALLWKKSEFFFKMVHSGVFYISERRRGPQTSQARGSLPPYLTLSTGLFPAIGLITRDVKFLRPTWSRDQI